MPSSKCGGCSKPVGTGSVQCSICDLWYHLACGNINEDLFKLITATHASTGGHCWACKSCQSATQSLNKKVVLMEKKILQIEKTISEQADSIAANEEKMDTLSNKVEEIQEACDPAATSEKIEASLFSELNERESKKRNIIVYKAEESTDRDGDQRKSHDVAIVTEIGKTIGVDINNVRDIAFTARLGQKKDGLERPLLVGLKREQKKVEILDKARKLAKSRFEHVSLAPDLTKRQREEEKNMKEKMDKLNADRTVEDSKNFIWRMVGQRGYMKLIKSKPRELAAQEGPPGRTQLARGRPRLNSKRGRPTEAEDNDIQEVDLPPPAKRS